MEGAKIHTFLTISLAILHCTFAESTATEETLNVDSIPQSNITCESIAPDFKQRYYNPADGKCYLEGDKATCVDSMTFIPDDESTSKYFLKHPQNYLSIGKCGCEASLKQYSCRSFPALYSEKEKQCYEMYTQGPCEPDEWFTPAFPVDESTISRHPGICQKNICIMTNNLSSSSTSGSGSSPQGHVYLHQGKCYQTFTRGHCGDPDEVAYFENNYPLPECGDPEKVYGGCKKAKVCTQGEMYHEASGQCFPKYSQGPCPDSMVIRRVDTARGENYLKQFGERVSFGKCDCQLSAPSGHCAYRPYVFSSTAQKCYPAFSQGPCLETEWFVPEAIYSYLGEIKRLRRGVCTPNDCLEQNSRPVFPNVTVDDMKIFYYGNNNQCFLTGTPADCEDKNSLALFNEDGFDPQCDLRGYAFTPDCRAYSGFAAGASLKTLGCPHGYVKRGQECAKRADF